MPVPRVVTVEVPSLGTFPLVGYHGQLGSILGWWHGRDRAPDEMAMSNGHYRRRDAAVVYALLRRSRLWQPSTSPEFLATYEDRFLYLNLFLQLVAQESWYGPVQAHGRGGFGGAGGGFGLMVRELFVLYGDLNRDRNSGAAMVSRECNPFEEYLYSWLNNIVDGNVSREYNEVIQQLHASIFI